MDPGARVAIHLPNANVVCLLDGLILIGWKMQWVRVKLRTMPVLCQGPWERQVNSRVLSGLLPMTGSWDDLFKNLGGMERAQFGGF